MGITTDSLKAIGHIKDHSGLFALNNSGHEILQLFNDIDISVNDTNIMPPPFERTGYALNGFWIIGFLILHAKDIDHAFSIFLFVVDNRNFQYIFLSMK